MSLIEIFRHASLVNQLILLTLFLLSVLSWTVILHRWNYFYRAGKADRSFIWGAVDDSFELTKLHQSALTLKKSTLAKVFLAAENQTLKDSSLNPDSWSEALAIERDHVRADSERGLSTLAVVASASPFIGLLGTVWGVMIAFLRLGDLQGQPALEVVGPGIAEALIATAAGLFAAIPATIAYNLLNGSLRNLVRRIDDFNRRLIFAIGNREEI